MKKKTLIWAGTALLTGFLLGVWLGAAASPPPDPRCLALDAAYTIENVSVPLRDGVHITRNAPNERPDMRTAIERIPVRGCLTRPRGECCAAVILTRQSGEGGPFSYVAAAIPNGSAPGHGLRGTNAIYLGDHVAVVDMHIESEILTVRLLVHAEGIPPEFPPTVEIVRQFFLRGRELVSIQ